MPAIEHVIPKIIQPILFLIEGTDDEKILNQYIETVDSIVSTLKDIDADLTIKISTYEYSSVGCESVFNEEKQDFDVGEFVAWNHKDVFINREGCHTEVLFEKLNEDMSRKKIFNYVLPFRVPIIIFLANGRTIYDWEDISLKRLKGNKFFRSSKKIFLSYNDVNIETVKMLMNLEFNEVYVITGIEPTKFNKFCTYLTVKEIYAHHNLSGSIPTKPTYSRNKLSLLNPYEVIDINETFSKDLISKINEINSKLQELILNNDNDDVIEIFDELVKVDPISDNDLTDSDWLSGDTEWD